VRLDEIAQAIEKLPYHEQEGFLKMLAEYEASIKREKSQKDFMVYVKEMWPGFVAGRHHKVMAQKFQEIADGKLKRLIICLAPRHTKSEFASYLLPSWFLGKYPEKKVIQASNTAELAVGFGRKVRNLVGSEQYAQVFPNVSLRSDSKAAGRWSTNHGGEYFAIGVGGTMTGKGADLAIIDDPHALEITTPIPTPNGFVEIQDLKVGDQVFGPDGNPIRVVSKSAVWHDRELYSVITDDNEEILCDAKHLWGINSDTNLARARVVNQTAEYLASWPQKNRPILPRHQPVQYAEACLPVDPWVLGAWLGDGTSSSGRITAHPDDQPYIIEQFEKAGYKVGGFTKCGYTFTVYGLHQQLKALGVLNNKHVPEQYLLASESQRMSLLQGLVDTDGSVTKAGQAGFYNANAGLVRSAVELLHSLGVKCQMRSYEDNRGRWASAQTQHRVMFRLEDCALMPRKRMYTRTPQDKRSRSITVEATGTTGSVQCITVDRPDGLFLAGRGYVVTHNSEQEARLAATNPEVFDSVFEWYTSGPRQRLQPNGAIIIVMCMTGDTPVLMADGTQKPLRDIRPADMVATFDNGNLSVSKINNWRSSGVDSIYRIQTQSGKILRSNERHPFLVMNEGVLEWTRLNQLRVGDLLVSLKDAAGHQNQKQSQTYANHVTQESFITKKTLMRHTFRLGLMASGKVNLVIVASQLFARACALLATESNTRIQSKPRSKTELDASSIGTASLWQSMKQWLQREIIDAMYAVKSLIRKTPALIGMESSALITAMTQEKSEGYSATTATLLLDTERRQAYLNELHRISDFTVDPIVSITTDGQEEVFDVEVDRTENFIANGVVSHNTRWSKKDLVGKVLQSMIDRDGEKWEVIEFPAILPSGQPLWPEFWSLDLLTALKDELPVAKWNAQYQQNPTSEEGAIIRREWWMPWEKADPPHCEYIIMTLDAAAETNNRSDYTALLTWGVFSDDELTGGNSHIILLNAINVRVEFHELKALAMREWEEWSPDSFIVEKKSSGTPLFQELRRTGIPVQEFTPHRGTGDKIARLNAVSDIVRSGMVWYPSGKRWADEVIEQVAAFPNAGNDDMVDCTSMALARFRNGGFIRLNTDELDEITYPRKAAYY
jgi:predicted phage terminase large subunit-like protein